MERRKAEVLKVDQRECGTHRAVPLCDRCVLCVKLILCLFRNISRLPIAKSQKKPLDHRGVFGDSKAIREGIQVSFWIFIPASVEINLPLKSPSNTP